jgi:acetyl-CoA carboxylase biotin carboxyl carrier protein
MTTKIVSDVAGTVWEVPVTAGQTIGEDDPVIVLESMKMEIPVHAPRAGMVTQVMVKKGDAVAEGQVIGELA